MGEPDSNEIDLFKQLALSALHPWGGVSAKLLRKTGLHRDVLQQFFDTLSPEIKNLVGWRPLKEYGYQPDRRNNDAEKGPELTQVWREKLETAGLSDEKAIEIYDGELQQPPAKDYRLFVLRDGRLLYYVGGFYAIHHREDVVCGDPLTVLDVLDKHYAGSWFDARVEPFIVIMTALSKALEGAIFNRKQKVRNQEQLQNSLQSLITQVSNE